MGKLVFVYNADSGMANALLDSAHKLLKPSTYSCNLCRLTHGLIGEKKEWKVFLERMEVEAEFYHRDEFEKIYASKFGHRFEFPLILWQSPKGLEVFMSKNELESIDTLDQLEKEIEDRL